MSTYYYDFEFPVTCVKVGKVKGNHVNVTVFVNHALAGTLTLREEELAPVLEIFRSDDAVFQRVATSKGSVIRQLRRPSGDYVVSDHFEIIPVSTLLEKMRKQDSN